VHPELKTVTTPGVASGIEDLPEISRSSAKLNELITTTERPH
jgi:hypothetical protein